MPGNTTYSIRLKLILPYAISLILIIISIQILLFSYQQNKQDVFAQSLSIELSRSLQQALTINSEKIETFINFIKETDDIQRAWLKQDRTILLDNSKNIYHQLRATHQITHFYFHEKNGKNFLRVHNPEHYGDIIERATLKATMQTLETASGLELGITGKLVLRTVSPWYKDGRLIGYIELGKEIDHLISRISEIHDYQIIFITYNTNTEHGKNQPVQKKLHYTSLNKIPPELYKHIQTNTDKNTKIFKIGSHSYLTSHITLKDLIQKITGEIYYLKNFDDHIKHDENFLWSSLLINTLVGTMLLLFYYFYSSKINTALSDSYNKLKTEIGERKSIENKLLENKDELEHLIEERNKSLSESKKRYRTLFEKTADALLLIEGDKFIDCNQSLLDMFLYNSKEEIYNTHPSAISPEFQNDGQSSEIKANLMMQTAFEKGSNRFEWNHVRKNGEVFPAEVLLTAIPSGDRQLLHAVVRDISDRKKAEDEIKYRAYYDSLTGLPNRQLLIDRLKHAIVTGRRRQNYNALLFIDLDRFKTINDSLGHSVGDLLLIEAARRITQCIREEDTASRFGGDEFVILIKNLGNEQTNATLHAKRVAEDIQKSFLPAFKLKDHELHISSSIGINLFPLHNETLEDIIKHADTAMYSAKEEGRNKIAFYLSEMHDTVLKRLNLEKDLRNAVKENALEVYYQPQVDNEGKTIGLEALIRWQHPEHGFVNPEEFISIAEDTGIIYDIGAFVLNTTIRDIQSLIESNYMPAHMSVNISPHQFLHPDFVNQVGEIIRTHNIEQHLLTLEVTERIAINNLSETINKFNQLRELGVRISLDDFGTGYSSLSYLKRLPLDELKIDKSFVFDIMRDPHDALLVQTIINIANQFGLDTVAEGVENEDQLNFLKQNQCKFYQGYLYCRPLPLEELKTYLLKN